MWLTYWRVNMQKDSNNIDQNTVVDKTNAILILCFLYSKLTALQIEEINQTDDTLNIDNSDDSVSYFNNILDGKTEINYQVVQQCIFLADQAPAEQLAKVSDFIYEHLKGDVNFSYSSQALDSADPKTSFDKLNVCLAVTAFELCVEEHETKSGKLIYGFCLDQKGLKRATVVPFDKYTFYKNGWFVRLNNVLNIQDVFENINTVNKYHAIVMNPPFGNAGSLAIKHIEKAFQHLHDGGRIVALIPNGAMESKIDKFMEREKEAYTVAIIQLPPSTFESAGTKVSTRIVIIEKHEFPEDAPNMRNIDLSSTPNNAELFEAIRYTEIVPRKLRIDEQLDQYGLSLSTDKSKYVLSGYGLNDPIIKKLALSYFDAYSSDFNDVIWSYNRSKDLMKKIRTYESENKTTLVQEKQNLASF